jgi:hypothetical protein
MQRAAWRVATWTPVLLCVHEVLIGVVLAPAARADDDVRAFIVSRRARLARGSLVVYDDASGERACFARVRGLAGDLILAEQGIRRLNSGEVWVVTDSPAPTGTNDGGGADSCDGEDGGIAVTHARRRAVDGGESRVLPRALVRGVPIAAITRSGVSWVDSAPTE